MNAHHHTLRPREQHMVAMQNGNMPELFQAGWNNDQGDTIEHDTAILESRKIDIPLPTSPKNRTKFVDTTPPEKPQRDQSIESSSQYKMPSSVNLDEGFQHRNVSSVTLDEDTMSALTSDSSPKQFRRSLHDRLVLPSVHEKSEENIEMLDEQSMEQLIFQSHKNRSSETEVMNVELDSKVTKKLCDSSSLASSADSTIPQRRITQETISGATFPSCLSGFTEIFDEHASEEIPDKLVHLHQPEVQSMLKMAATVPHRQSMNGGTTIGEVFHPSFISSCTDRFDEYASEKIPDKLVHMIRMVVAVPYRQSINSVSTFGEVFNPAFISSSTDIYDQYASENFQENPQMVDRLSMDISSTFDEIFHESFINEYVSEKFPFGRDELRLNTTELDGQSMNIISTSGTVSTCGEVFHPEFIRSCSDSTFDEYASEKIPDKVVHMLRMAARVPRRRSMSRLGREGQ